MNSGYSNPSTFHAAVNCLCLAPGKTMTRPLIRVMILLTLFLGIARADEKNPPPPKIRITSGESIAFLGDSITEQAWTSVNGYGGWYQPVGHIHLIMRELEANGIHAIAIPAGVGGNTSRDMLARFQGDVLDKKPTWLTLSCGVNDLGPWFKDNGRNVPLPEFKTNVTTMIDQALAAGIKVVVLTATPIYEDQPTSEANTTLVQYNDFLRALAKEKNCLLTDVSAEVLARRAALIAATGSNGNKVTSDGVHMNTEGSMATARAILRTFGFTNAQLDKARDEWLDIPDAVKLPGQTRSGTIRQRDQLLKAADAGKSRLAPNPPH